MAKKALGKGLEAIISKSTTPVADFEEQVIAHGDRIVHIDTNAIKPNPDQPRTHFDENEIKGLAESIRSVGMLQPIIVRRAGSDYFVVAGERRLRASKRAGVPKIRAIVIQASEEENITLALVENIQRANLDPIEEAKVYRVLSERFSLTQNDIAGRVGKDRATIANLLRLLALPSEIQASISAGELSVGHAKVLLGTSGAQQKTLFREIIDNGLSVRALESRLAGSAGTKKPSPAKPKSKNPQIRKMEELLVSRLGTKVEIKHAGPHGTIEISYYSLDDFDRIVELIT